MGTAFMRKYTFTPEEQDIIRRDYKHTHQSLVELAEYISRLRGTTITPWSIRDEVKRLGIPPRWERVAWTQEEDAYLEENYSKIPLVTLARQMHREAGSLVNRARRLHISRRIRSGWFDKRDVMQITGQDHKKVQSWIDMGLLPAGYQHGERPKGAGAKEWRIEEADLVDFILKFPSEIGVNADRIALISLFRSLPDIPQKHRWGALHTPQQKWRRHPAAPGYRSTELWPTNMVNPVKTTEVKIRPIGHYHDGKEICRIWLVDGKKVRDHILINFTMGGHHYIYNHIPENEIWIDDNNYKERAATIVHEVDERNKMKFKKLSYSKAHKLANRKEKEFRKK